MGVLYVEHSIHCKEHAAHKEFKALSLDVPISYVQLGEDLGYPLLKPTDFVRYIARFSFWEKLFGAESLCTGEKLLTSFWNKYQTLHPSFELFHLTSPLPVHRCVPVMVHGDEGQHFKKGAVMVLQWQGILGLGTTANQPKGNCMEEAKYINQRRVTLSTRFLCSVMPKDLYRAIYFLKLSRVAHLDKKIPFKAFPRTWMCRTKQPYRPTYPPKLLWA